jgi:hypothetical protein
MKVIKVYEKSLKILGLSGNFDRMDLEVAYNKAKQKSKNNLSNEKIIKVIEDAYNYLLEDMLNKEEVKINIDNLPKQESIDIRLITLIKALEYTLDDESKIDKELRNYDANFEDLDNAIRYFELVNMREALKNLKSRKNK